MEIFDPGSSKSLRECGYALESGPCLEAPEINWNRGTRIVEYVLHSGHHDHRIPKISRPSFKNTDFDIGVFGEACSNDKASRASTYHDKVIFMLEKFFNGAKSGELVDLCHLKDYIPATVKRARTSGMEMRGRAHADGALNTILIRFQALGCVPKLRATGISSLRSLHSATSQLAKRWKVVQIA